MSNMKQVISFLLLALALFSVVHGGRTQWRKDKFVEKLYKQQTKQINSLLSMPQIPQRYLSGKERFFDLVKNTSPVLRFSWSSCGQETDAVKISSLSIQPDPITIPGDLTVSFQIDSAVDVPSPLQVDLDIQKKVAFWWMTIPCIDGQGSCSYADFCQKLPSPCPPDFIKNNIPCNCPFNKGSYTLNNGVISVPKLPLPEWATSGDYKATAKGSSGGQELFCINVALTLN